MVVSNRKHILGIILQFLGAAEKRDKKKKRVKKKVENDGSLSDEGTIEVNESFKNCAYGMSYKVGFFCKYVIIELSIEWI